MEGFVPTAGWVCSPMQLPGETEEGRMPGAGVLGSEAGRLRAAPCGGPPSPRLGLPLPHPLAGREGPRWRPVQQLRTDGFIAMRPPFFAIICILSPNRVMVRVLFPSLVTAVGLGALGHVHRLAARSRPPFVEQSHWHLLFQGARPGARWLVFPFSV